MRLKDLIDAFNVRHEEAYSKGVKLQVVENDNVRMFKLDGATNSILNKKSIYTGGYWDYFIPIAYAYENPRILMIGLGIGTTPYQLRALLGRRFKMDIVELDSEVVRLARKYALVKLAERIFIADGCDFVKRTRNRYDLVILDAYGRGANIPPQFLSESFIGSVFGVLRPRGALAINYAMHPLGALRFGSFRNFLKKYFKAYSVKTDSFGDMQIIIGTKDVNKRDILARIRKRMRATKENRVLLNAYRGMSSL